MSLFVAEAGQTTSPVPIPVELITGFSGSVLSIEIFVPATTSLRVFTSAPDAIPASFDFSAVE